MKEVYDGVVFEYVDNSVEISTLNYGFYKIVNISIRYNNL